MTVATHEVRGYSFGFEGLENSGVTRYDAIKSVFDIPAALVLLIISAPVALLAMLLVRLTSRGPAVYTQKRLGYNGRALHDFQDSHNVPWKRVQWCTVVAAGRYTSHSRGATPALEPSRRVAAASECASWRDELDRAKTGTARDRGSTGEEPARVSSPTSGSSRGYGLGSSASTSRYRLEQRSQEAELRYLLHQPHGCLAGRSYPIWNRPPPSVSLPSVHRPRFAVSG